MKKIKKILHSFFKIVLFLVFLFAVSFAILLFYFQQNYKGKVFPNIYFNGQLIARKSNEDVLTILSAKKQNLNDSVSLKYEDKEIKTTYGELGLIWDEEKTAKKIMSFGRSGDYISNFSFFTSSFFKKYNVEMEYSIDNKKINDYLKELANHIDKEPIDTQFEVNNQRVTKFVIGSNGKKLFIEDSIKNITSSFIEDKSETTLLVQEIKAKGVDDVDKMGIKEVIATGKSNFAGSPTNRIHNISTGSAVFNGFLIAPGENFSFINVLGEVSAKTGYLPELVIKEDKTIPEYGGGLCQVSTTFFRAAINAGFPILERTAHAYRVSYYEPAGMDSTIYQPKPDLVFKNDTSHYIMVQSRIVGSELFVDFYGTNDGRKVDVGNPVIYNITKPADPIMIETKDLAPGVKRQTDTAHNGADAYFDRVVTYANGEKKNDRFNSHYIAWRAKFLVGKALEEKKVETNSQPVISP